MQGRRIARNPPRDLLGDLPRAPPRRLCGRLCARAARRSPRSCSPTTPCPPTLDPRWPARPLPLSCARAIPGPCPSGHILTDRADRRPARPPMPGRSARASARHPRAAIRGPRRIGARGGRRAGRTRRDPGCTGRRRSSRATGRSRPQREAPSHPGQPGSTGSASRQSQTAEMTRECPVSLPALTAVASQRILTARSCKTPYGRRLRRPPKKGRFTKLKRGDQGRPLRIKSRVMRN